MITEMDDSADAEKGVPMRTPTPSDLQQIRILMNRNLKNDYKKPRLTFARVFLGPCLWMLYTLGYLFNKGGDAKNYVDQGGFRLYKGETLPQPQSINLAGNVTSSTLQTIAEDLRTNYGWQVTVLTETNKTFFEGYCDENIGDISPSQESCIFLESELEYTLLFGGGQSVSPYSRVLAGTQSGLQESLLKTNGFPELYPLEMIQKVPELTSSLQNGASEFFVLFPGVMLALATAISMQFILAPLSTEKFKEVIRSFLLIGVKMRVYLHQWQLYLSLCTIATAGILTIVSFVWGIFAASSAGLVFLSHFLAHIQVVGLALVVAQLSNQEELTQGLPFLISIASMAVSIPIILAAGPSSAGLAVLTVISPFIGMMQYCGIYGNFDSQGYEIGVHASNIFDSGLLGNMLAQMAGILLCNMILFWIARPRGSKIDRTERENDTLTGENFEPLPPGSDVLLTVRGLEHTYESGCCRRQEPVDVLKGLDMDICRGEVFSYLGVNGAGKTTSVNILSGELPLTKGSVTYHLKSGNAQLPHDATSVRKHVGVCPQHNDSLHGDSTCREMLSLFARLKGNIPRVPGQSVADAVEAEVNGRLEDIQFTSEEDADKLIDTYSGGMKRKVCIALALLGDPEVIFLDEPTAGMDPYNRRQVWDMIIAAKKGRSIILTTHFMDEADVLGDRVGIIKDGRLCTSGSTLFLKHHFGAGYSLQFDAPEHVNVGDFVEGAESVLAEKPGSYQWTLQHGTESSFPDALRTLKEKEAENVKLELTTLEEVFLEMSKSDTDQETLSRNDGELDISSPDQNDLDEEGHSLSEDLAKIWKSFGSVIKLSFVNKFLHVQQFMLSNAWRIKGSVFLNIAMPLAYLVAGMVVVSVIDVQDEKLVTPEPILMAPALAGRNPSRFFGIPGLDGNPIAPMIATDEPNTTSDYFTDGEPPVSAGYWSDNVTLQHNETFSPFFLQVGLQVLANYTALLNGSETGLTMKLQQLSYTSQQSFRVDTLVLPMMLAFGFAGMAFSVLDILLLKADNIIGLFRVTGITEWSTYLGVMCYKFTTTFAPFFILVIILGFALNSVLMGNGGRWLGTISMLLAYAFSNTVIGLLLAKRFIRSDFKAVANWFPGVYMTLVSLPYLAWNIAFQNVSASAQDALLIVADVLCVIPPFAFQRGLGGIIAISTQFDDPDLSWGDVWSWDNRVWFCVLMMMAIGCIEWSYLYFLTASRPAKTALSESEAAASKPIDISSKPDVVDERERSLVNDNGINARDLVKLFRTKPSSGSRDKQPILKSAVKGVSVGVKENEVYVMLGPNGSGKTTQMKMLAGEHTPDNGELALEGSKLTSCHRRVDHLYEDGHISYCQQFDALFPKKSVVEHLRFYAKIRGLDWEEDSTKEHIDAIVRLMGLQNHRDKMSTELSGGYKRRLCLGVAMIGFPKCMLVDECTTGMDPGARHLVWTVIKPDVRGDYDLPAILLSTHYMDEAEKLGSRIGILIDGELVTTGSLSSLQDRYCNSFFVEVALLPRAADDAQEKVVHAFEQAAMKADVYESLPYHFKLQIPFQEGNHLEQLASIFDLLETKQEELDIKFYSVAQMSLEQIFIDLSRKQFAADEVSTRRV